jgi:glycerophosphoryl diester phosphodiesterase
MQQLPQPTIFAHRGASAYAPENTLAAFKLAVEQKAPAIELDAKLSADGQIVVIHDQTVNRTTQGSGKVGKMSLAALRELDAGIRFNPDFKGEKIPTLEEVFETVGKQVYINIELTNYTSTFDDLPEKAADMVKRFGLTSSVIFSSFNPIALLRAKRVVPETPIGLLALPGISGAWARSNLGNFIHYQALHPELSDATENLVQRIHRRLCRVHVYTINRVEDMRRLFAIKVDGIFTDDPLIALKVAEEVK